MDFEEIRSKDLLMYEFIRGSHCHGLETEKSDIDKGGVYLCPVEDLYGLGLNYQEQVSDKKSDVVWFEFNRYMKLLLKSNPTVLESLFIDDKFVLYENDIIKEIKNNRDVFITKQCFNPFFGYSVSQIKKAKGLNKKINFKEIEKKDILDFCYTYKKQGSINIKPWFEERGLDQKYCGLVNIPNMDNMFGCYYDFGAHFKDLKIDFYRDALNTKFGKFAREFYHFDNIVMYRQWFENLKPIGYRGLIKNNSTQLRFSSVEKGENPICYISYNEDNYSRHCREYKEYMEWKENRNPIRYESNLEKSYDAKNICECLRLMNMCIEIAKGNGVSVNRKNIDRDFLLSVKNHKFEYEDLIKIVEDKQKEMDAAIKISAIPDKIDENFVNDILIKVRKQQIENNLK